MGDSLQYAVRSSDCLKIVRGISEPEVLFENPIAEKSSVCRVFQFSNSGQYFCYCDSVRTVVVDCTTWAEVINVELPRTQQIAFSPRDRLVAFCEPYVTYVSKENTKSRQPDPNLRLFSLPNGSHLETLIAQKQNSWKIEWTDDEVYSVRLVGSEILVHKYNNFTKYESKLSIVNVQSCSMSPGCEPHHIAIYVPALKGQAAFVQLRMLDHKFTVVASKTFFQCDKINLSWNCKGSTLIVMTTVDVDKSNQSYYGEQSLFLMGVSGDSCVVPLEKKGPIYSVKWHPNGKHFIACHGFMPSKVTVYSAKGQLMSSFGEGPRNEIYFNRFGNIVILCGFGNIASGRMEFWDFETYKQIVSIEMPSTTLLEWAPDGQHLLVATTTPRLRTDNGYKILHYTGRVLHQFAYNNPLELYQVQWRPMDGVYNPFKIAVLSELDKAQALASRGKKPAALIHPVELLAAGTVSKSAYVPPHLRKPGSSVGVLKASQPKLLTEKEKKVRALKKKLDEIEKLKARKERGDALEANQLDKIDKQSELANQLSQLKAS